MSTDAQIAANRNNAQASSGPVTAAGKARVSRNSVSHGLYSSGDFILPGEHDLYAEFCVAFQTDLAPEGAVEQTLAAEIVHAAWRLRRCSLVESAMTPPASENSAAGQNSADSADDHLDPPDPLLGNTQLSIDRARAHANRVFHRAALELRRLQTERRFRIEALPEGFDSANLGLASYKDIAPALTGDVRRKLLLEKLRRVESRAAVNRLIAEIEAPIPAAVAPQSVITKQTQSGVGEPASIGRNSPCTCGSGIKFKRCCGKGAPAVLNIADRRSSAFIGG
jgi:SEC-C motif